MITIIAISGSYVKEPRQYSQFHIGHGEGRDFFGRVQKHNKVGWITVGNTMDDAFEATLNL